MSRHSSSARAVLSRAVVGLAMALCCAGSTLTQGQSIWELTPYRVRLHVAMGSGMADDRFFQEHLTKRLVDRCNSVIGATWNLELTGPADVSSGDLQTWFDTPAYEPQTEAIPVGTDESFDKLFVLKIENSPLGDQLECREFDARTRTWSPIVQRTVTQPSLLVETAFDAILEAFAPLAKIEEAEKDAATLRIRGGALPRADEAWQLIQAGDLLRPLMRFNDRDGTPRKVLPIEWTYLLVDSIGDSTAQCQIHSGLRNALSARTRGRIERLALLVHPRQGETDLQLVSRGDREDPLEGYTVYAHPANSKTTTKIGQSDDTGHVVVPSGEHPLRILLVKHGGDFLAKLPMVPGLVPSTLAEIPNDDERLQVVGIITGMQETLVDLVVRREMLLLRLRASIEAREFEKADEAVARLRDVRLDEDQFRVRLRQRQQAIVSNNPVVQRRIDRMFGDTSNLMANYFDPRPIMELEAQLVQARTEKPPETPADNTPEAEQLPEDPPSAAATPPSEPAAPESTPAQTN